MPAIEQTHVGMTWLLYHPRKRKKLILLRVHGKVVILQAEISQESGMTFRKSARWPIVSVRLTSCILRQTIRMELG